MQLPTKREMDRFMETIHGDPPYVDDPDAPNPAADQRRLEMMTEYCQLWLIAMIEGRLAYSTDAEYQRALNTAACHLSMCLGLTMSDTLTDSLEAHAAAILSTLSETETQGTD